MNLKEDLEKELEDTHQRFLLLLDSIPETAYSLPTDNPPWTVGDVLYHITLGPRALAFEIWMIVHLRSIFQFGMNHFPSKLFNLVNARFAKRGNRITRQRLTDAYRKAHAVIRSRLKRTKDADFSKSVNYPVDFVSELAGKVSVERLFRYVKGHFDVHEVGECLTAKTE
jgi:hypothetical protein